MKKVLSLALALVMVCACAISFTGCGSKSSDAVKIGCIYIGSMNDGGFTQVMHESLTNAAKEVGAELIENENTGDSDKMLFAVQHDYGGAGSAALETQSAGHPDAKGQEGFADAIIKCLKQNNLVK